MPDPREIRITRDAQKKSDALLKQRDALKEAAAGRTAEIQRLEADLSTLEAAGDRAGAERLRAKLEEAGDARRTVLEEARGIQDRLRAVVDELREIDPCDADPARPLLLLPVRIETRYADRSTLRVRIFPDPIHIDQLDRGMTEEEVKAGAAYWTAARDAEGEALEDAWTELGTAVGPRRAPWVALGMAPSNREEWLDGAAPVFPEPGPRQRAAAVARLLPDRFVVVAKQGAKTSKATTSAVAAEVVAGLLTEDGTGLVEVGGVKVPEGGEWMVDYAAAKKVGLAVDLRLGSPGAVDRLYVVGVRRSLDPARTRSELEALLTGHRCTRGLAFVPQGSPSNNTARSRSEWSVAPEREAPTHLLSPSVDGSGNASVLARALGIGAGILQGVDHADEAEHELAGAINAALWPTTWGTYIDRLTEPDRSGTNAAVSDATEQAVRDLFRDHVRGRGPLPNLRVGNQPYGFLPVTLPDPVRTRPNPTDRVESRLLPLLKGIRSWWESTGRYLPQVGKGSDLAKTLLDIMGMHPVSPSVRARNILSDDAREAADMVGFDDLLTWQYEVDLGTILWMVVGVDPAKLHGLGSLSHRSRPVPFPLVHASDPAYVDGLLAGEPPPVRSLLQAMLGLALDAARRDVDAAAPANGFDEMLTLATALDDGQRSRLRALQGQEDAAPAVLHKEADRLIRSAEVEETGRLGLKTYQPLSTTRSSFAEVAKQSTIPGVKAEVALWGTVAWLRARARLAEVRAGMTKLRDTGLRQRALLFGELLDLCSHRLDAWWTAVVDRRRTALRAKTPDGLVVGAFGWVEDLAPGVGTEPDGGYIHAPSLDHAATAGILRSAYLTHNADNGGDGAYAIDLSSERVRTALHLIDGIRQGQPMGALLGYRIERALHEVRLDRLIRSLRRLAPLVARRLTDRDEEVPPAAAEAIAANNVVDGLRLIERFNGGASAQGEIRTALDARPEDNPYLEGVPWPSLTDGDWTKVVDIIRDAEAAADAAADLLLAESVHQIVRGNTARAGATLSAAGSGEVPPPEPEVIRTPAPGTPFAHRILIALDTGTASWSPGRPRAMAEPALEAWAADRLGDPADVVVTVNADDTRLTLADTGLCALDVLYDAGDPRVLEQRVRAALPAMDDDGTLTEAPGEDWAARERSFADVAALAAAIRAVVVGASPAGASDFCRPSEAPTRGVTAAGIADVVTRAQAARGGLATALAALEAALTPPGGSDPDPVTIQVALEGVAAFGAVAAGVAEESPAAAGRVAAAEARRRLQTADRILAAAPLDAEDVARLGETLFGDGFHMLPVVEPDPGGDLFSTVWGALAPTRSELRRFVRDVGSVRAPVGRLSRALLLSDAVGSPATLGVAQLAANPFPWVGGVLGADVASPDEPITNVLVDAPVGWDPTTPTHALVVDRWTDVVPALRPVGGEAEGEEPSVEDRRSSGIALNAASASARAPQAALLAVTSDGQRWTTDRVLAVLDETLALMKLRGLHLGSAPGAGRFLPALHLPAWSIRNERVFDLRFVAENPHLAAALKFVKEPS